MEAFRKLIAPRQLDWLEDPLLLEVIVVAVACLVFLGTIVSPPSLMDDVDSAYAQVARVMLESGDWVTGRLDGIVYVDKPPLQVWAMALSFWLLGVKDWVARLPLALASVALSWAAFRFGRWAFSARAGLFAGLTVATSIGMFLFTRVRVPDAGVALTTTLALWAMLRQFEPVNPKKVEEHEKFWAAVPWICFGVGLLLKGLIAIVLPAGAALLYLAFSRQLLRADTWRRLRPVPGILIMLAIAAPWHVLAMIRNPPLFDLTMTSAPGQYRGFFWRYFINEHLLRYLGQRFPRDYNTVPLIWFWLLHLVWLFPWSAFAPAAVSLDYKPATRAGRVRLLALCQIGFTLLFFSFSTRQEYYSLPAYPAMALLIGSAIASDTRSVRVGVRAAGFVAAAAALVLLGINIAVWDVPAIGGITHALTQNPDAYTLSLGHMQDLTLESFAYLRWPAFLACAGFLAGAAGAWFFRDVRGLLALAAMMMVFVHAARLAMVEFDPYLSSRPLAEALERSPPGRLIVDHEYYAFASVFFYTDRQALLLNGRKNNLEYGSNAPGAPEVFIEDADLKELWDDTAPWYLLTFEEEIPRLEKLVGSERLRTVEARGGKILLSNQ